MIFKEEWASRRDGQVYARGDRTKSGNPNLRVVGDKLRVTVGTKQFAAYKLFVPVKFRAELDRILSTGEAYNVRLIRKDANHWKVIIDYSIEAPVTTIGFQGGAIGIDTNPDRIAVANVSADGNLVSSMSLVNNRLYHASQTKREYDIGCAITAGPLFVEKTLPPGVTIGLGLVGLDLVPDGTVRNKFLINLIIFLLKNRLFLLNISKFLESCFQKSI